MVSLNKQKDAVAKYRKALSAREDALGMSEPEVAELLQEIASMQHVAVSQASRAWVQG